MANVYRYGYNKVKYNIGTILGSKSKRNFYYYRLISPND